MRHIPDPTFPLSNIMYRIPSGFFNSYWRLYELEAYACQDALNYLQQTANGEFIPMAKKRNQNATFGVEFINIDLTDKQGDDFNDWQQSAVQKMGILVGELASAGHKLGISFDGDNECFIVSVTSKDEVSDNFNKCYTSRSDDWIEAVLLAVFKWDVIMERSTWTGKQRKMNWG